MRPLLYLSALISRSPIREIFYDAQGDKVEQLTGKL